MVMLTGHSHMTIAIYRGIKQQNNNNNEWEENMSKVVIITDLGKDKNQHKMLKIQQIFPKLNRGLLFAVFLNLESQNAGLVDVKIDSN